MSEITAAFKIKPFFNKKAESSDGFNHRQIKLNLKEKVSVSCLIHSPMLILCVLRLPELSH